MSEECISKLQIAERQLETAIGLLVSGADYASVVASAGVADAIFMGWVLKAGKACYVGDSRIKYARDIGVETPPRGKYASRPLYYEFATPFARLVLDYIQDVRGAQQTPAL